MKPFEKITLPRPMLFWGEGEGEGEGGIAELPTNVSAWNEVDWNAVASSLLDRVVSFAVRLAACVVLVAVGLALIAVASRVLLAVARARQWERTVVVWLSGALRVFLKVVLALVALSTLGLDMATATGLVAAAGVALSAALGTVVLNLVAGAALMVTQPMRVGDWVTVAGCDGVVVEIALVHTTLCSYSNTLHIVPNTAVFNAVVTNHSARAKRRLDIALPIAYAEDIDAARDAALRALRACPAVLAHPRPLVAVDAVDGARLTLAAMPWARRTDDPFDFVTLPWALREDIVRELRAARLRPACDALRVSCQHGPRAPAPRPAPRGRHEAERLLEVDHDPVADSDESERETHHHHRFHLASRSRSRHSSRSPTPALTPDFVYDPDTDVDDALFVETKF